MSRSVQYPRPICPKCKRNNRARIGYDLVEVKRTAARVYVRCNFCHHHWWSTNAAVRAGVLRKLFDERQA